MKIQDAISRLSYTISKEHKPNSTDKIALNKIIEDYNSIQNTNVQEHILFAKLYAVILADFVKVYQDIDFANKMINKELQHPIDYHLQKLLLQFKQMEMQNFWQSQGILDPLFNETNHNQYTHIYPNIDVKKMLETLEAWDIDNVTANFTTTVNQSILCFKQSQ